MTEPRKAPVSQETPHGSAMRVAFLHVSTQLLRASRFEHEAVTSYLLL